MLPKIKAPIFKVKIDEFPEEIAMRPFTLQEEKILLMAKQSGDREQIFTSIVQVVQNCIVDEKIKIEELPYFLIEYLFIMLRVNSVGAVADIMVTDPDTKKKRSARINMENISIVRKDKPNDVIELDEETTLYLSYPPMQALAAIKSTDNVESYFQSLMICLDKVTEKKKVHEFKNYSFDEIEEFLGNLRNEHLDTIKAFYESIPHVVSVAKYQDTKGNEKELEIKGLYNFF